MFIGIATIATADPAIHIELNAAATGQQDHCRLSFVIENNAENAIDTLKLDLAVFDREGAINRRIIVEIGPLRAAKTIVRTFSVETDCGRVGSILLNDVTACSPGETRGALIGWRCRHGPRPFAFSSGVSAPRRTVIADWDSD